MAFLGEINDRGSQFANLDRALDAVARAEYVVANATFDRAPSHLASFGNRDATRLAHDTLSVFHRQLTERLITMRVCEAKLEDAEAKRLYRLESKKEMLKIIEGMETTLQEVPAHRWTFHDGYADRMRLLRENVATVECDDNREDEVDDGGPLPVHTAEKRVEIEESRFSAIPPEVDLAIQSFLPLTDRMRGARVNHVFHRGVQPLVPELLYQNMREFNDFYCRLWHTFGPSVPIGENGLTWGENPGWYALRGSCAQDIQLNHEKMAWECASIMSELLEFEESCVMRGYAPNEVGPAIKRIINELAPSVSAPFQKILRESLETAQLICALKRMDKNKPNDWLKVVDSLINAGRYSEAMLVAYRSSHLLATPRCCEVIKRAALADRKLAAVLAARFVMRERRFEAIVQIIRNWPDQKLGAFKDEMLLLIHDKLVLLKMNGQCQSNEPLRLRIQKYLEEKASRIQSVDGGSVESKEPEPEEVD